MNSSASGPSDQSPPQVDLEPTLRLDHYLKLAGLVSTGGQAKLAIQAGEVLVNDEVETRRRRQIRSGDFVTFADQRLEVEFEL